MSEQDVTSPGWDYLVTTMSIEVIGDEFGVVVICCAIGPEHCGALVPAHMRQAHDDLHYRLPAPEQPNTVAYDIRPPDTGRTGTGGD